MWQLHDASVEANSTVETSVALSTEVETTTEVNPEAEATTEATQPELNAHDDLAQTVTETAAAQEETTVEVVVPVQVELEAR